MPLKMRAFFPRTPEGGIDSDAPINVLGANLVVMGSIADTQSRPDRIQYVSNHGFIFNPSQDNIRGPSGFAKRFPKFSHGKQRL